MSHVQQQILDALKVALVEAKTAAGANVFIERLDPLTHSQVPALVVQEADQGEAISQMDMSDMIERGYAVDIGCVVEQNKTYGNDARALGLQVEQLLGSQQPAMVPLLELCAGDIRLVASRMVFSGESESAVAVRMHTWLFTYQVHQATPDRANFSPYSE